MAIGERTVSDCTCPPAIVMTSPANAAAPKFAPRAIAPVMGPSGSAFEVEPLSYRTRKTDSATEEVVALDSQQFALPFA